MSDIVAREAARAKGDKLYASVLKCAKHGTVERYTNGRVCLYCVREKGRRRKEARQLANGPKRGRPARPRIDPQMSILPQRASSAEKLARRAKRIAMLQELGLAPRRRFKFAGELSEYRSSLEARRHDKLCDRALLAHQEKILAEFKRSVPR
jgi:hypothetical protein